MKLSDLKPGDQLVADECFTCLREGEVVTVERDGDGDLFVRCAGPDEGENAGADHGKPSTDNRTDRHTLDGQEDQDGNIVGFARAVQTS